RAVAFKQHLFDKHALVDRDTRFCSMIDQQFVELSAGDLPRHRTLVMHGFEEIERTRFLARRVSKLDAVLSYEWALFQLVDQTHAPECPISVSHQRLADVMTGKNLFFEQDYLAA